MQCSSQGVHALPGDVQSAAGENLHPRSYSGSLPAQFRPQASNPRTPSISTHNNPQPSNPPLRTVQMPELLTLSIPIPIPLSLTPRQHPSLLSPQFVKHYMQFRQAHPPHVIIRSMIQRAATKGFMGHTGIQERFETENVMGLLWEVSALEQEIARGGTLNVKGKDGEWKILSSGKGATRPPKSSPPKSRPSPPKSKPSPPKRAAPAPNRTLVRSLSEPLEPYSRIAARTRRESVSAKLPSRPPPRPLVPLRSIVPTRRIPAVQQPPLPISARQPRVYSSPSSGPLVDSPALRTLDPQRRSKKRPLNSSAPHHPNKRRTTELPPPPKAGTPFQRAAEQDHQAIGMGCSKRMTVGEAVAQVGNGRRRSLKLTFRAGEIMGSFNRAQVVVPSSSPVLRATRASVARAIPIPISTSSAVTRIPPVLYHPPSITPAPTPSSVSIVQETVPLPPAPTLLLVEVAPLPQLLPTPAPTPIIIIQAPVPLSLPTWKPRKRRNMIAPVIHPFPRRTKPALQVALLPTSPASTSPDPREWKFGPLPQLPPLSSLLPTAPPTPMLPSFETTLLVDGEQLERIRLAEERRAIEQGEEGRIVAAGTTQARAMAEQLTSQAVALALEVAWKERIRIEEEEARRILAERIRERALADRLAKSQEIAVAAVAVALEEAKEKKRIRLEEEEARILAERIRRQAIADQLAALQADVAAAASTAALALEQEEEMKRIRVEQEEARRERIRRQATADELARAHAAAAAAALALEEEKKKERIRVEDEKARKLEAAREQHAADELGKAQAAALVIENERLRAIQAKKAAVLVQRLRRLEELKEAGDKARAEAVVAREEKRKEYELMMSKRR